MEILPKAPKCPLDTLAPPASLLPPCQAMQQLLALRGPPGFCHSKNLTVFFNLLIDWLPSSQRDRGKQNVWYKNSEDN